MLAFALPKLYSLNKAAVDKHLEAINAQFDKLGGVLGGGAAAAGAFSRIFGSSRPAFMPFCRFKEEGGVKTTRLQPCYERCCKC